MSVGRVCLDGESGRLNASSVALELAQRAGAGASSRMTLDLREVPAFGVFPGQVIGVRGAAPTGQRLIVSEIFANGAAPRAQIPLANARALHRARTAGGAGPVRVWCACGPYSSSADLKYDPLTSLLAELGSASPPPDVLVLQGPFVDAEHPTSRSGVAEVRDDAGKVADRLTFRGVWDFVLANLGLYLQQEGLARLEVVLMPSAQDVNAAAAFPQWPMQREDFATALESGALPEEVLRRITVLPNPATFVVGDLVFGASSVDTVFHLAAEDATSRTAAGGVAVDRFSQLARYMLEQRCYYPLYPAGGAPPGSATAEGALPLEVSRLWNCGMGVRPDVLLAPTKIGRPCVRPVGVGRAGVDRDATVVVNPGFVAKGVRAGTFAKLAIFAGAPPGPAAGDEADAPDFVSAGAAERVLVEICSLSA
jgi:DNA polymerase alpha subunit B